MKYSRELATVERNARIRARHALRRDEIAREERAWRDALKRRMIDYLGGACRCCDLTPERAGHVAVFEFHHRDPGTKTFNLSGNYTRSWRILQRELDKCDLVCANCHRTIEATLEDTGRRRGRPLIDSTNIEGYEDDGFRELVARVQLAERRAAAERADIMLNQLELLAPLFAPAAGTNVHAGCSGHDSPSSVCGTIPGLARAASHP